MWKLVALNIFIDGVWNIFKRGNSFEIVLYPFWKGVYSKRKEFAPRESKFFSFEVDPFSEDAFGAGKQTEIVSLANMAENLPSASIP